jgi:hypothetical protein
MAEAKAKAYRLYMAGWSQKEIAEQCSVTEATVSRWTNGDGWGDRLGEEKTSSVELANSLMFAAKMITEVIITEINKPEHDIDAITKLSDNVVKIMASAERVANTVNKSTVIDVLTSLDRWLLERSKTDRSLTPELLAVINRYHQEYINNIQTRM